MEFTAPHGCGRRLITLRGAFWEFSWSVCGCDSLPRWRTTFACPRASFSIAEGTSLAGLKGVILERYPSLRWPPGTMLAVNQEYAGPEQALRDGDEIAVIPPVSGG